MAPEELQAIVSDELNAVMTPYVGMAFVLVLIWIVIAAVKMPTAREATEGHVEVHLGATLKRLVGNGHYRYGVIAQFFNVAAQTCVWTFTIQYAMQALSVNEAGAGPYLQYSLLVFLVSRFVMTWAMGYVRPSLLLGVMALLGTLLCVYAMFSVNITGVWAIVAISASLSLMFPTIYGIALHGLGGDRKIGAAGLVMAILGGAIMPLIFGAVMDASDAATGYIVPAVCFLVVALYAAFDLTSKSRFADWPADVAVG